jgi:hypothetical protein
MDNFNLKQYLFESRVGMYSKAVLNESALLDAETLAGEIAKQHPELIRYHHDGEGRKLQDAIFTYAGEILQGAGIPLQTVRGLAYDTAWALDLVNGVKSALEHGDNGLEEASSDSIKVLRDLYYFDKLSLLAAKEDVDPKYYKYGTLWISKGDVIDSNQEEYDMIIDSDRLEKGVDYIDGGLQEVNPSALGAPQAAADAKMQQQDDENGDMVDNVSMGLEEENPMEAAYGNVGSVDKVKPAETGISKYLDILNAHDWFYHFSDDHRTWQKGQADKDNLKALYSTLTPNEKQQAMDTFVDKYLQVYKPDQFPAAANNVKYLTTDTFKGAI